MIALNLEAKTKEQELIKTYLEENARETLAEKINAGTPFEKDGKTLINRKTLDGFMSYALEEAKKLAAKGARGACIEDKTVYGWAIHYFEEESIEGTLYNEDGTEYKPKPKNEPKKPPTVTVKKPEEKPQLSLFDFMDSKDEAEPVASDNAKPDEEEPPENGETDEDDQPTEEEIQEILKELAEEDDTIKNGVTETKYLKIQENPNDMKSNCYKKYTELQRKYPEYIIAMQIGDFYEVFGQNAVTLADELDMTLTSRDCGLSERVPMIGFPHYAVDKYIAKISGKHALAVVEPLGKPESLADSEVDIETGEILTETEMRQFDGDLDEPENIPPDMTDGIAPKNEVYSRNPEITRKLSDLLGDICIVR